MKLTRLIVAILLVVSINVFSSNGFAPFRDAVVAQTIDSPMPSFENKYETDHFVLKWTNRSGNSKDNIRDPQIIKDTAGYLEDAWAKYTELFGRKPYTAPGRDKIDVVFRNIDCFGVADPPDGPIQFDSVAWVYNKGIRQPTSAHELFHRLQYSYGYKTKWMPKKPFQWFTEGTAAWSEVYVWGKVSRDCKVDTLFKDTSMDLYSADTTALPFWIYFVQGNHENPDNHLMVEFLEKCEQLHDERLALNEVIHEKYGSVDGFFKDFEKNRKAGFYKDVCSVPYSCILGPQGKNLVDEVKSIQRNGH
ncbi:MAG: DUF6055 domain-containing protein [Syntrophobacteraceae bacterium]